MTIKITEKILSIPPYISTSWSRIGALYAKGSLLSITLTNGVTIEVPGLDQQTIESIYHYHAQHIEKEQTPDPMQVKEWEGQGEPNIRFAFGTSLEGLGSMMRHNPSQADSPDLPPEILQKIRAITKIIASADDSVVIPKAEPNCNCFHCQIARALNQTEGVEHQEETEVHPDELIFQEWNITQTGDKLYQVVNRLDPHESYQVFLGEPIGCTCGKTGCEHILAVLKS